MLLLTLLAVLGNTVDYNVEYTKDNSNLQDTSVDSDDFSGDSTDKNDDDSAFVDSDTYKIDDDSVSDDFSGDSTSKNDDDSAFVLGQNYIEVDNGEYTHDILYAPEKYTMDYSHTNHASDAFAQKMSTKMQIAEKKAEEALGYAEQKEAEAEDAYEQKMVAEKNLQLAEERYEEVHSEKMVAKEANNKAVIRWKEIAQEAENAREVAANAKENSERAALKAFEAAHSVEMQEANEAIINAKLEQEEHFHAELEYKEKLFHAEKESLEAKLAEEDAQEAAVLAEKQNQEAKFARAEVQVAGSHRDIQKAEAIEAHNEAGIVLSEQEVAEAHHENVIASKYQYYEENHHKEDQHSGQDECLSNCLLEVIDMNDPGSLCPWWQLEGPEHNAESCFNDCSPALMIYLEHQVLKMCHGGPNNDPMACMMDCPTLDLDPESAESFCPWFSEEKNNECFHDCTDTFMNLFQAHAEHTCHDYDIEADKYINYISEPISLTHGEAHFICLGGYYLSSDRKCIVCPAGKFSNNGDNECSACPNGLTSFPGAASRPEDCFVRASREIVELTAPTSQPQQAMHE